VAPVSYSWFEVDHSLLHRRETSLSHTRPHLVLPPQVTSSLATLNIPARNSSSAVSCMVGADRSKARSCRVDADRMLLNILSISSRCSRSCLCDTITVGESGRDPAVLGRRHDHLLHRIHTNRHHLLATRTWSRPRIVFLRSLLQREP